MTLQIATIAYLFVAIAMVVLILMQRGSSAGAGAGFGGGGSASVFGASGSTNFLSKSTKWLAIVFFVLSLGMAVYVSRGSSPVVETDLGVMGAVPAAEDAVPREAPPETETSIPEPAALPVIETEEVPAPPPEEDPAPETDPQG